MMKHKYVFAALAGRKATLRVEEGKFILNIVSDGMVIIVR